MYKRIAGGVSLLIVSVGGILLATLYLLPQRKLEHAQGYLTQEHYIDYIWAYWISVSISIVLFSLGIIAIVVNSKEN